MLHSNAKRKNQQKNNHGAEALIYPGHAFSWKYSEKRQSGFIFLFNELSGTVLINSVYKRSLVYIYKKHLNKIENNEIYRNGRPEKGDHY